jgi:hypothetical protein
MDRRVLNSCSILEENQQTCKPNIFSLAKEINGKITKAFFLVSKTLLIMSTSATRVLPAEVGAEYTKLPPKEVKNQA